MHLIKSKEEGRVVAVGRFPLWHRDRSFRKGQSMAAFCAFVSHDAGAEPRTEQHLLHLGDLCLSKGRAVAACDEGALLCFVFSMACI